MTTTGHLQPRHVIDVRDRVVDENCFAETHTEPLDRFPYSPRRGPYVDTTAGIGVDSSQQPESLGHESDHGFDDCSGIQGRAVRWR